MIDYFSGNQLIFIHLIIRLDVFTILILQYMFLITIFSKQKKTSRISLGFSG